MFADKNVLWRERETHGEGVVGDYKRVLDLGEGWPGVWNGDY